MFYKEKDGLHKNIYDENWNQVDYTYGFTSTNKKIKKPSNFDEIIKICDKLSEDTNYVRVDLYNVNNRIYFGELTFIPGAGYAKFEPYEKEFVWGEYMGEEKVYRNK